MNIHIHTSILLSPQNGSILYIQSVVCLFLISQYIVVIVLCQQVMLLHSWLHNIPTLSLHQEVAWVLSTCGHLSYFLFGVAVVLLAVTDRYTCLHVYSGISGALREVLCSVKGNRHLM